MAIALKSAFIAAAMLFPVSVASAQAAKPQNNVPATLEINQILGLRKVDAAIWEISARLEDGSMVELRMNTFVAQDLSRQLGNFSRK
jgi:hypothetical protein